MHLLLGSCLDAGFTDCCTGSASTCLGTPTLNCYCDRNCHSLGDCCDDIEEICSAPTQLQPGKNNSAWVSVSHSYMYV